MVQPARRIAALEAAKLSSGFDLRALFEEARAFGLGEGDLFLPTHVSRKPTQKQLSEAFEIDMGSPLEGAAARARIVDSEAFGPDLLGKVLAPGAGIRETWYYEDQSSTGTQHAALFMDEHDQIWGFFVHLDF
jgi:hypothetical protein